MQSRINITTAPASQPATKSAAIRALIENPFTMLIGVNHATRDGQNRPGITLSGKTKLRDVATQIQYFVVAEPRCIDVRSHAATQTMDPYRRWTSIECDRFMIFSCSPPLAVTSTLSE